MILPATWILFLVALPRSRSTREHHHGKGSQDELSPSGTPPSLMLMQQFDLGDETQCSDEVCSVCDMFAAAPWNLSVYSHAHGSIPWMQQWCSKILESLDDHANSVPFRHIVTAANCVPCKWWMLAGASMYPYLPESALPEGKSSQQ